MRRYLQEVIDKVLYTGERETVPYAVASRYSRDILAEERIAFLKTVFQAESGFGMIHEKQQYTVWFTENGLDISRGKRLRNGFSRTSLSWVEIDKRIETLLEEGTYLSQTELEKAKAFEFSDVSQRLLYLYGDIDQENEENRRYLPIIRGIRNISGGYPVWEQELPKLLAEKSSAQAIYEEFQTFAEAYAGKSRYFTVSLSSCGGLGAGLGAADTAEKRIYGTAGFSKTMPKVYFRE